MKLFGTDGIRGKAGQYPMDAATAARMGRVFAHFLGGSPRVGICGDTRASTSQLKRASSDGLQKGGATSIDIGILPTPAVACLIKKHGLDGAIMVSASHNPAEENGLKFFTKEGLKLNDGEEERLESLFFSKGELPDREGKQEVLDSAESDYMSHLKSVVSEDVSGIRIVIDPGNGAATSVSKKLFESLGMNVIMINANPNGLNINLNCGAMHTASLQEAVKSENADLGAAFDGDADRVILVDELGNEIDGDYIMAIIGSRMIKESELRDNTLVATQYSNLGLKEAIEKSGGRVIFVENGDKYVVEKLIENRLNFGGEKAGHIILFDYSTTGDGLLVAACIVNVMKKDGRKLSELASVLSLKSQVLVNVDVKGKISFEKIPGMAEAVANAKKMLGSKGRVFVRYSGTQNVLRIMIEGDDKEVIRRLADSIAAPAREMIGA